MSANLEQAESSELRAESSITEADVRAWLVRRLRELETEYGVRVNCLNFEAHRSLTRNDLPADDYFSVSVHASGECNRSEFGYANAGFERATIANAMGGLVMELRGNPASEAARRRSEAAKLLREADELVRLAAQPIGQGGAA